MSVSSIPYVEYRKKKNTQSAPEAITPKKEEAVSVSAIAEKDEKRALPEDMSDEAKIVYSVLNENGVHIDDIVRETNLKMNVVLSSLTELEILDLVQLESGKKYKII